MNLKSKFAIELKIDPFQTIENRLEAFFLYVTANYKDVLYTITDLEATGPYGMVLSRQVENSRWESVTSTRLLELLREDGQIIELGMFIENSEVYFKVIVRGGQDVNIISSDRKFLVFEIIGNFKFLDIALFNITKEGF